MFNVHDCKFFLSHKFSCHFCIAESGGQTGREAGETLTSLVLVCVVASQISLDTDNNTEYPDRATHNHYTKLYSFRLSCNIVSFTAAKTNRMFSVSVREKLNLNQSKCGEKASRRLVTK